MTAIESERVQTDRYNPGPLKSLRDYQAEGRGEVPEVISERSLPEDLPTHPVSTEGYISWDFARAEFEGVWMRTWQMVCRERSLAEVGDYTEYRIGDQSIVVVRDRDGQLRAYQNACLHRGTCLVAGSGRKQKLRCGFHGWEWSLDGKLAHIPARWDFPQVKGENYSLPEIQVDTWAGWVFVNFDENSQPLADFMGPTLTRHMDFWRMDRRPITYHGARRVRTNWKIILEQFIESYHALATHPQTAMFISSTQAQYDIYPGGHSRFSAPFGVADALLGIDAEEQDVVDAILEQSMAGTTGAEVEKAPEMHLEPGQTARSKLADLIRHEVAEKTGRDTSTMSDAEALDSVQYCIFPNLVPFTSTTISVTYRARPLENLDPDWCVLEIMVFGPAPADGELPPDPEVDWLEDDEPFSSRPGFGGLGRIFDQDMANMEMLQRGLHQRRFTEVTLSQYQEGPIRAYRDEIDKYLNRG